MGIFAFYNGLIYNEFFAIPFEMFGSCYDEEMTVITNKVNTTSTEGHLILDPMDFGYKKLSDDCVYTFGVDPRWFQSTQNLAFTNNLKMKIAVILAIL